MARSTDKLGNGRGYIYITKIDGTSFVGCYNNDINGIRSVRHNLSGNAPIAAERSAISKVTILGCASIGQITNLIVSGNNQIAGPLNVATSVKSALATQIALAIASFTPAGGPNYSAVSDGDDILIIEPVKSAGTSNGVLPTMSVTSGTITFSITAFENGAAPSGDVDKQYGYRAYLGPDQDNVTAPPDFVNDMLDAFEVSKYVTPRGTESGFPVVDETVSGDRLEFASVTRTAQEALIYVLPESGVADVCAYINPEWFIEGDKLMIRSKTTTTAVTFADARTASTYSPEPFPNIYLNRTETWITAGNAETLTLQYHYDDILGPMFLELSRTPGSGTTTCINTVTRAEADGLIATSGLKAGCKYLISDRADAGILITAASNKQFELQAEGRFFNSDFQGAGDYSGIPGVTGGFGNVWNIGGSYGVNYVAIWGPLMYLNITGSTGTQPDLDVVNWQVIPKSATTGYILETDNINYDYVNDWIEKRECKRGNLRISYYNGGGGLNVNAGFQWGNNNVTDNKIYDALIDISGNSYIISENTVHRDGILKSAATSTIIQRNIIYGEISGNEITGSILDNIVSKASKIVDNISNHFTIRGNNLIGASEISGNIVNAPFSPAFISYNILMDFKIKDGSMLEAASIDNSFLQSGELNLFTLDFGGQITKSTISNLVITGVLNPNLFTLITINSRAELGFSNFTTPRDTPIDITGVSTIDYLANNNYVGDAVISSGNPAETADKITNAPTNHRFRLRPVAGLTLTLTFTAVAGAAADNMVGPAASRVLNGTNNDYIEFENIAGILYETEVRISI